MVESILYSNFKGNRYTIQGLAQERMTIKEYIALEEQQNIATQVSPNGLFIHPSHNFLAATPDGIVTENGSTGLIEIKNVLLNKNVDLKTAAKTQKSFCLEIHSNKLRLKKNHNFHYQIQGQLAITNLQWCDLVVRCRDPYGIHVERITRDDTMWASDMLPKLDWFYHNALLPELAWENWGLNTQKTGELKTGSKFKGVIAVIFIWASNCFGAPFPGSAVTFHFICYT